LPHQLKYADRIEYKRQESPMNEVVDQIATKAGISPEIAERAVGMMLGFLQREAPDGPVSKMIARSRRVRTRRAI